MCQLKEDLPSKDELKNMYWLAILGYCYTYIRKPDEAKNLAQIAFDFVLKDVSKYPNRKEVIRALYTTANSLCANHLGGKIK